MVGRGEGLHIDADLMLRIGGVYGEAKPGPASRVEHVYVYNLDQQRDRSAEFRIDPAVF